MNRLSYFSIYNHIRTNAKKIECQSSSHEKLGYAWTSADQFYYFEMEEINPKRLKYQPGR